MDYAWKQKTRPTLQALGLAQAKTHLSIGHCDDDDNITDDIAAALKVAEEFTGRVFGPRSFTLTVKCWPCDGVIRFPVEPVLSITTVKFSDTDNVVQTVDSSQWRTWLDASPPVLRFISGFTFQSLSIDEIAPIEIEFVAGETDIPATLRKAIQLTLGYWQQFPGGEPTSGQNSRGLPAGAISLLDTLWVGA